EFVETLSVVEHALRGDPADVYNDMDFATRDHYRHVVEQIAKNSPTPEEEVAARAIELSRAAMAAQGPQARAAHVGYFLVDDGLPQLQKACHRRRTPWFLMKGAMKRAPLVSYVGAIGFLTALITALLAWGAREAGMGWGWILVLGLLPVWGALHLSIALINFITSLTVAPRLLPRLDFAEGIPSD